jgi:3-hydroxymyristoyl/3-hydroxydecanoyl-(acyl carrier protein) dehydratase
MNEQDLVLTVPQAPPLDGVLRKVVHITPDLAWFEGHFPSEPVLAGVVQLKWAVEAASQLVAAGDSVRSVQQLKFKLPIRPPMECELVVERVDAGRAVIFRYVSAAGEHSSGRLVYR